MSHRPGSALGSLNPLLGAAYVLPTATVRGAGKGWVPMLAGTAGDDVFDPGTGIGASVMTGNGGDDVFYVHSGNDRVVVAAADPGRSTIILDGMSRYTLTANVANLVGAAGVSMTLTGNALDNIVRASDFGDTIDGGAGNDTLVGGAGRDSFVETKTAGSDTIVNFQAGAYGDAVTLRDGAFADFGAVQQAMTQSGGDVVLTLGAAQTLTFTNRLVGDFVAANFGMAEPSAATPAPASTATPPSPAPFQSSTTSSSLPASVSGGASPAPAPEPAPVVVSSPAPVATGNTTSALLGAIYTLPAATLTGAGKGWVPMLVGTAGDDVFDPGTAIGASVMTGNGGDDVFYVHSGNDRVMAPAGGGRSTIILDGMDRYSLPANVANLVGAANSSMTLTGNVLNNIVRANDMGDTIDGGTGNDTLVGGAGRDSFVETKTLGSDTIVRFQAGPNGDAVTLRNGAFADFGTVQKAMTQSGADVVLTLGAAQTLTFADHRVGDFVAANFGMVEPTAPPPAPLDPLLAASYTPPTATLTGAGRGWVPTLTGTAGDDVFDPGTGIGASLNIGNGGNDVFYVHAGGDQVVVPAGQGRSTVVLDGMPVYTLPDNVANLVGASGASMTLTGNALDNIIRANDIGGTVDGGAGNDTLVGGAGRDTFVETKGNGSDTLVGFQTGANGDVVSLRDYAFGGFSAVRSALSQSGGDVVLALGGDETLTFAGRVVGDLTAANFGMGTPAAGAASWNPSSPPPVSYGPSIAQASAPGELVGFALQNPNTAALAARLVSFGQTFLPGQVPAGGVLQATIGGRTVPVQMDVKATNPDGSVRMAVLTLEQPALAASASLAGMLALAPSGGAVPAPLDLARLTGGGYSVGVDLALRNADGSTTPFHIDAAGALAAALRDGTVSYWQQGPLATQGRIDVPVTGALRVTFDITLYADGSTQTDVQFNNDAAMGPSGGELRYDVTLTQNNAVAFQQSNVDQFQYQTWHKILTSNGPAPFQPGGVNIQQDTAAMARGGFIQNFDPSVGVATALIGAETAALGNPNFGILGNADVTQYMPMTGGRADIGPTTQANAIWLMTQDAGAAQYALAQADASGSVPWHQYSTSTGTYLTATQYPTLWNDGRGGSSYGTTGLTQQVASYWDASNPGSGWAVDPAHQPDLAYNAYLLTGSRYYLDQMNAQATYDILNVIPGARGYEQGVVLDGYSQVRAQAWNLRQIQEAAFINPDAGPLKAYFQQVVTNSFGNLLTNLIPAATTAQGQAYGWVPGDYGGGGTTAPWQQDYMGIVVAQAALQGNPMAREALRWEANYLVGRFLQSQNGFDPHDAVTYNLVVGAPGALYQTWAEIEAATAPTGMTANFSGGWSAWAMPSYQQWAMATLAGAISVEASPQAIQAYGWMLANSQADAGYNAANPAYAIVPRLPDGELLTRSNVHIVSGGGAASVGFGNADQLVYDTAASGNTTIVGGTGTDILFAGGSGDLLLGGAGDDYLFAGSGNDTLVGGAGTNWLQAGPAGGPGTTRFDLSTLDAAQDVISGFVPGRDQLHVTGAGGAPLAPAEIQGLLATATSANGGGTTLTLAPNHLVTLAQLDPSQLTNAMFV